MSDKTKALMDTLYGDAKEMFQRATERREGILRLMRLLA